MTEDQILRTAADMIEERGVRLTASYDPAGITPREAIESVMADGRGGYLSVDTILSEVGYDLEPGMDTDSVVAVFREMAAELKRRNTYRPW